jgi:hypothetical protein
MTLTVTLSLSVTLSLTLSMLLHLQLQFLCDYHPAHHTLQLRHLHHNGSI